ncbi:MAG: TonB-dependent receptor [SAR324 cluster bacterium]|uniref:TonB-dependent receptor n=1 Tax=SAR324 cluster bacterium TaxID=2024889 RepID=A0A7X9FQW2_9DELT|nr:TonB-dependent receptor [SAR324 cluster bacterium]
MKRYPIFAFLFSNIIFFTSTSPLRAEELPSNLNTSNDDGIEIVVSANRVETPKEETASSVTVIDAKEMEQKQETSISDVLRSVPSADVVRSGGLGGNTSVFLRGANPEHTLVLIDGIEVNNPITTSRVYNFADLVPNNIERIEVLRGPQGPLYGSSAMGGVVSVFTRKGTGEPSLSASSEAGSYSTFIQKAGLSGGTEQMDYSVGLFQENSGGISAAGAEYGNEEHDGYENTALSTRLGYSPVKNFRMQSFLHYLDAEADLDNAGGIGGDDLNRESGNKQVFGRIQAELESLSRRLKQQLGVSLTDQQFEDNNNPDALHPSDVMRSRYVGRSNKIDFQNTYKAFDSLTLILGAQSAVESGHSNYMSDDVFGLYENNFSNRSATTNSYFGEAQTSLGKTLFTNAGIRFDDHSRSGSRVTWRIAPAYIIHDSDTKLSTTVATGFKSPSLYQLYSSYGNENLDPERSLGLDAAIEQSFLNKGLIISTGYFYNKFNDLISFEPNTFLFENISRAKSKGIETSAFFKFYEKLRLRASYTFTDTEDEDTGMELLRRARNKFAFDFGYDPLEKLHLNAAVLFNGKRYDNNYSAYPVERVGLGGYALVNFAVSYDFSKTIQIFARIDNIFDRNYEEVYGYGNPGAAAYGGLKFSL